jgi:amino acid adenylation domain-containing protein
VAELIHQLFEEQVVRTPDDVALIFRELRLTYRELNRRANQLAHYLGTLGVGAEVPVAICVERSADMIVAILGILKAGGAYVSLDPNYPLERLEFMLADSQAQILLTQANLVTTLNKGEARVVCIDTDWDRIAPQSTSNPLADVTPQNLAYVIYTSGSTGKPKGVGIEHRATVALLSWATSIFTVNRLKGVLASTSISFDVSVFEIFAPLSCGGAVILAENVLHLSELPAANDVTLISTAPSIISELLLSRCIPSSTRTINLAGEPLKISLVNQLYALGTVKEVFDLYGPTEDTTYSTFALRDADRATIGRPILGTQAYVLDRDGLPVAVGETGELGLAGAGLARGYLNRPELTAESFVPNPFSSEPNSRLYKTGDLARYLPDGNLEYLGRIDHQVKIRGVRIELGEIEAVISQHETVRECVVLAREDRPGDYRLVAYVVEDRELTAEIGELRSYLENRLPAYMVPSAFVKLDRLPMTPNGKIDRKALPAPEQNSQRQDSFLAPRDEIETTLAQIWEKVLGIGPVGVTDSFFELGGNSLLAARMFSETSSALGKNPPLATLFEVSTIEHLANRLREDKQPEFRTEWSSLVPIQPRGSKPRFFCVHAAGGNVLGYRALVRHLGFDQPFYGLQSVGLNGNERPLATVEEMAAHYITAISGLQSKGPYFLGGFSFGGLVAFEMARQLKGQGHEIGCLALFDTSAQLDHFDPQKYKLSRRIELHLDNLLSGSAGDGLKYVGKLVNNGKKKIKKKVWKAGYSWYRDSSHQLPSALRNIRLINDQAAREYVLRTYPSRVSLFRASDDTQASGDDLLGWDKLTAGVDLYPVPGSHLSLVKEPYVQVLAEQLTKCIDRAAPAAEVAKEQGKAAWASV